MAVTPQPVIFRTDNKQELTVSFQAHNAINYVNARTLKLPCPLDIGLLIETGLDLNKCQHLFARMCCIDQRINDRRIAGCAVKCLFDRQDLWIGGGLLKECLHRC